MNMEEYIKNRVDDQISYFEKKSKCHKICYYLFAIISIISSIVAASIMNENCILASQILSIIVALSIGVESLFSFKEKWIIYRNTAEMLKSEKVKFKTYKNVSDSEKEFVNRIEEILSNSNSQWKETATKSSNKI